MYTIRKLIIYVLAILFTIDNAFAGDVKLLPPILKASKAAYDDYVQKLATTYHDDDYLASYMKNIENYEIKVKKEKGKFIVYFSLISPSNEIITGGGAKYTINQEFKITSVLRYK
jgi:hypothetical protein